MHVTLSDTACLSPSPLALYRWTPRRDLATQPRGDAWHEALQRKRREGAALSRAVEQNSLEAAVREVLLMSGNSLEDRIQIA